MAIDFRLTARQRELQLQSRKFAREVLAPALEAEALPTPEERFAATRTAYEAIIAAGLLRKCIPLSAGGERKTPRPAFQETSNEGERPVEPGAHESYQLIR